MMTFLTTFEIFDPYALPQNTVLGGFTFSDASGPWLTVEFRWKGTEVVARSIPASSPETVVVGSLDLNNRLTKVIGIGLHWNGAFEVFGQAFDASNNHSVGLAAPYDEAPDGTPLGRNTKTLTFTPGGPYQNNNVRTSFDEIYTLTWGNEELPDSTPKDSAHAARLDAGTEDNTISGIVLLDGSSESDKNKGGEGTIRIGRNLQNSTYGPARTLMRFDTSSLKGKYTTIERVKLKLFVQNTFFDPYLQDKRLAVNLHPIAAANGDWTEGDKIAGAMSGPPDVGETTWNHKVQGLATGEARIDWAGWLGLDVDGVDFGDQITTQTISESSAGTAVEFVIEGPMARELVEGWNQSPNEGIILRSQNDSDTSQSRWVDFHSSETADPALRPQLVVEYTKTPIPAIGISKNAGGKWSVGWTSEPSHFYQLEYTDSLTNTNWLKINDPIWKSYREPASFVVDPALDPKGFWRVRQMKSVAPAWP